MPLGKLSKKQIQEAYKVLTELTEVRTDCIAVDTCKAYTVVICP